MNRAIAVVSPSSLETWDWRNPWTKGIGGSEVAHIETADRLKGRGFDIRSFTHTEELSVSPAGVSYEHVSDWSPKDAKVTILYRHPESLDVDFAAGSKIWFIAQDVEYGAEITAERADKIDRYICLCKTHAQYTMSRYPFLRGKVYISSNGVRSAVLDSFVKKDGMQNPVSGEWVAREPRVKHRMLYASSPDRGLELILRNWFRIKEKVPEAELRVAYGFDNCEKIVALMGGNDWRAGFQKEMEALLTQPGVTFTGRLNQAELYKEWFSAGVWFHPSDFAETSCITVMDAVASGCWPVANKLWAVGSHLERMNMPDLFSGIPQKSALVRSYMLEKVCERLRFGIWEGNRQTMAEKARRLYDWERIADQWQSWLEEDLAR